jgi:NDP-sugar pyrophosphorylase family protein
MAGKMKAYDSGEFSMDIGTPESLAKARKKWAGMLHDDA